MLDLFIHKHNRDYVLLSLVIINLSFFEREYLASCNSNYIISVVL